MISIGVIGVGRWGPNILRNLYSIDDVTVNAVDLLPEVRTYYRYDGSFTTPPCTEGVNWFLMDTPVELSTTQIDAFKEIYSNNYRPVQPLNDREFMTN